MGFGHVQRSLPLIKRLLAEGASLTLVSDGDALVALQRELAGEQAVQFMSFPDYPPMQRGSGLAHYWYFFADLFDFARRMREEKALTARLVAETAPDMVIADGRFGFRAKGVPCFLICHQIRQRLPPFLRPLQWLADLFQLQLLRQYGRVLVPDFAAPDACLSGTLSHNWIARRLNPAFVGLLSAAQYEEAVRDIDLLFLTGGYLEGPKAEWEAWVARFAQAPGARRIVSIAGGRWRDGSPPSGVESYDFVPGRERDAFMNRAKAIVARAGYTTIMDLVALRQDAILIPTPGMTEQNYLVRRFPKTEIAGQAGCVLRYADLPAPIRAWRLEHSLEHILDVIGMGRSASRPS